MVKLPTDNIQWIIHHFPLLAYSTSVMQFINFFWFFSHGCLKIKNILPPPLSPCNTTIPTYYFSLVCIQNTIKYWEKGNQIKSLILTFPLLSIMIAYLISHHSHIFQRWTLKISIPLGVPLTNFIQCLWLRYMSLYVL